MSANGRGALNSPCRIRSRVPATRAARPKRTVNISETIIEKIITAAGTRAVTAAERASESIAPAERPFCSEILIISANTFFDAPESRSAAAVTDPVESESRRRRIPENAAKKRADKSRKT